MIHRISSRSNQKLRSLLNSKDQFFFFEGEKLVKDLLAKKVSISKLIINQRNESYFNLSSIKVDEIWFVDDSVLKKISSLKEISDFIAVVKYKPRKIDFANLKWGFILDNVQDPGNAGTVFRCAAAFGMKTLILSGDCVRLSNPKLLRTAQTSIFDVDFQYFPYLENVIEKCQQRNINIYLTSADISYKKIKIQDIIFPCVIILGNEGKGLRKGLFSHFYSIRIPQKNTVESLNVGVSACIIMYELSKIFNQ